MKRSLFVWIGSAAAIVIVVASLLVRSGSPGDEASDVERQRADVARFHELVRAQRWDDVFDRITEPPAKDSASFVRLMREQARKHGAVTSTTIESMRLLRSRTVPLLEVHETLTLTKDGRTSRVRSVSYFARRGERWLFAFSAPDDA